MKMQHCMRIIIVGLALIVSIAGTFSAASAAEMHIIANKNVPVTSITSDMLKDIFLGKKNTWDNGTKIEFATMDSVDFQNDFLKTHLQKSASQYNNYWKQQVFTGKGQMPKSFNSDKAMLDYVASMNGAIGSVSGTPDIGSVKIITVK